MLEPPSMQYSVHRNLVGLHFVKYVCPKCKTRLRSPLADAGNVDKCPDCGQDLTVPGAREKREADSAKRDAAVERRLKQEERKQVEDERKAAATNAQRQRRLEQQRLQQQYEFERRELANQPVSCPYCGRQIQRGVQKCGHCGEWLIGTGHSDAVAGALGCLLGSVGLWYKGHWAAGFAWLAAIFLTALATGGFGLLLAPLFWIGMAIHAAAVQGRR